MKRLPAALEIVVLVVTGALVVWGLVFAFTPRADAAVDADFAAAAAYVKANAKGAADYVLVRPTWELAGARAFLPLAVGVYKSPVPQLWAGRERLWVVTAHGADVPHALRASLQLGEEREFGALRVTRFDVRR